MKVTGNFSYRKTERFCFLFHDELAPKGRKFTESQAREIDGKDGWHDGSKTKSAEPTTSSQNADAFVDKVIAQEKSDFIKSVVDAVKNKQAIEFSNVFDSLSDKEIKNMIVTAGLTDKDSVKSMDTLMLKGRASALVREHNERIAGKQHG